LKKIALLGPSDIGYTKRIDNSLKNRNDLCWGWTYTIDRKTQNILNNKDNFMIYAYESITRGGNGFVTKKYKVDYFKYHDKLTASPKSCYVIDRGRFEKCRGWFHLLDMQHLKPIREWEDFRSYGSGEQVKPINKSGKYLPNVPWEVVIDEF